MRFRHPVALPEPLPEGREDPVRRPLAGQDLSRLAEERTRAALRLHGGGTKRRLDRRVARDGRRLVAPVPHHAAGAGLPHNLPQNIGRRTPPKAEGKPQPGEIFRQRSQALVQPPAGRAAKRPDATALLIQHEQGDDGPFRHGGGGKSGVVANAQIPPEPDDDRSGRRRTTPRHRWRRAAYARPSRSRKAIIVETHSSGFSSWRKWVVCGMKS